MKSQTWKGRVYVDLTLPHGDRAAVLAQMYQPQVKEEKTINIG